MLSLTKDCQRILQTISENFSRPSAVGEDSTEEDPDSALRTPVPNTPLGEEADQQASTPPDSPSTQTAETPEHMDKDSCLPLSLSALDAVATSDLLRVEGRLG